MDPSLIRADFSWEGLAVRHADAVADANDRSDDEAIARKKTRPLQTVCIMDLDGMMATNGRSWRLEPA